MPEQPPATRSSYLVEWYEPGLTDELLEETALKIDRSARHLTAEGSAVDLLLTVFVPDDEVAFCLFAANSPAAVTQVCRHAKLPLTRIAAALATAQATREEAEPRPRSRLRRRVQRRTPM